MNLSFYKIAILNDILGLELTSYDIKNMVNPEAKSKFRNLKKSTDVFTKFVDDSFIDEDQKIHEAFGDLCDNISAELDRIIKEVAK